MKRIALLAVALAGLALAGCKTNDQAGPAPDLSDSIAKVQNAAVSACGYLPTAESAAAIITTFTGGADYVSMASQVARAICKAVTAKSAVRGRLSAPKVNGVAVQGRFVR